MTTKKSSSIWGCELKCVRNWKHIVRVKSSSIWGCELKFPRNHIGRASAGHPLYEDVNWNASCNSLLLSAAVILYMRMWIEIRQFQIYISHQVVILYMRMWIEILPVVTAWYLSRVILYMRMWIEIFHQSIYTQPILVILYMRMWIEMIQNPEILQIGDASSSIWGCELKYGVFLSWYHIHIGHPLYEDVNWNSTEVFANDPYFRHPLYEDVNWNTLVVHEKSL